jgi:hypothetical protein
MCMSYFWFFFSAARVQPLAPSGAGEPQDEVVTIHIKEDIFVVEVSDNAVGRTKRIAVAEKPLRAIGLVRVRIVRRIDP